MRVADYLVSYSLEINNRCLRYLAECDTHGRVLAAADSAEPFPVDLHSVYTETLLAKDSRRLCSMWWLTKSTWHDMERVVTHVAGLRHAATVLTEATSHRRLALRMASVAVDDGDARAILQVARKLPHEHLPSWETLNDLFARDSALWRETLMLRDLTDEALVERVVGAYRKGYRLGGEIGEIDDANLDAWLDEHGDKLYKYAQLCTHHMELLRPALSDSTKAQLWYLDKMSDSLRMRTGLRGLERAMRDITLGADEADIARAYIEQQIMKMNKRIVRLVSGCYATKPKRFAATLESSVEGLGLRDITLVSLGEAKAAATAQTNEHNNAFGEERSKQQQEHH